MIKEVEKTEIKELASLASSIWHEYWTCILSLEQIDYMVEKFQSESAIQAQIKNENYTYYFIYQNDKKIGYVGVCEQKDYLFLSKFYIKKNFRHQGTGTKIFEEIKKLSKNKPIKLTVNKYNHNTIKAYEKWGFKKIDSVITDIGKGFVMDDYIMIFYS